MIYDIVYDILIIHGSKNIFYDYKNNMDNAHFISNQFIV